MSFDLILTYLLPPVIGAVIGLFTNYLAIKMLFRPFSPWTVFGLKVPFTPGVIPKQHERLAEKIGETVGNHLISTKDLHNLFRTEQTKQKILDALEKMYSQFGMLSAFITQDIKDLIATKVIGMLDAELPAIIESMDIKKTVTEKVKAFSLVELEKLILDVAKAELAYVTWFGGILGFMIGLIQVFIYWIR